MDGKVCPHCREVNPADARECRGCGRYFIRLPGGEPPPRAPGVDAFREPAVISALVLLVSLFLPWFSLLIFSFSAVQLLGLSREAAGPNMRVGGVATLAMVRLLIALIPVGCLAVIVLAMRGVAARLAGILTGLLPLGVFFILLLQSTAVVNVMGAGFVIAIISGLALTAFSRRES